MRIQFQVSLFRLSSFLCKSLCPGFRAALRRLSRFYSKALRPCFPDFIPSLHVQAFQILVQVSLSRLSRFIRCLSFQSLHAATKPDTSGGLFPLQDMQMLERMADNTVEAHNQGLQAGPRAYATPPTCRTRIETEPFPISLAPTADPKDGAATLCPLAKDTAVVICPALIQQSAELEVRRVTSSTIAEAAVTVGAFPETAPVIIGPQEERAMALPVFEDDVGMVAPVKVRVPATHTPGALSRRFNSRSLFAGSLWLPRLYGQHPSFQAFCGGLFRLNSRSCTHQPGLPYSAWIACFSFAQSVCK